MELDTAVLNSRQADMLGDLARTRAIIVGCGSVGSNVAHMLVSMGVTDIVLVDPDEVAPENIWPSWYDLDDVEVLKVAALSDRIESMGGNPTPLDWPIQELENDLAPYRFDIAILATHSIHSRREAWEVLLGKTKWYIDCRVGGEMAYVYTVDGETGTSEAAQYHYMRQLQLPDIDTACGRKASAPLTKGIIPGLVGKVVRDISLGIKPAYCWQFNLDNGELFKVDNAPKHHQNGSN